MAQDKRKIIMILPQIQIKWAALVAIMAFAGMLLGMSLLIFLPIGVRAFSQERALFSGSAMEALQMSWVWMILVSVFTAICAFIAVIFYSHKFAGPLFKIERSINNKIKDYEASAIYLRDGDELKNLAGVINKLFEKYDSIIKASLYASGVISEIVKKNENPISDNSENFEKDIKGLKESVSRIDSALEQEKENPASST